MLQGMGRKAVMLFTTILLHLLIARHNLDSRHCYSVKHVFHIYSFSPLYMNACGRGISALPYGRELTPEQFLSELCCESGKETAKGAGNDGGGERTPMTLNGSDAEFPRGHEGYDPSACLADPNWRGTLSNLSVQTPECFFSYFMGFSTGQEGEECALLNGKLK